MINKRYVRAYAESQSITVKSCFEQCVSTKSKAAKEYLQNSVLKEIKTCLQDDMTLLPTSDWVDYVLRSNEIEDLMLIIEARLDRERDRPWTKIKSFLFGDFFTQRLGYLLDLDIDLDNKQQKREIGLAVVLASIYLNAPF